MLGPENRGVLAMFSINVIIVSLVSSFGIPELLILKYQPNNNLNFSFLILGVFLSTSLFIVVASLFYTFTNNYYVNYLPYVPLLLLIAYFESYISHFRHYCLGMKNISLYNYINIVQAVVYFISTTFFIVSNNMTLLNIVISIIISRVTVIFVSVGFLFRGRPYYLNRNFYSDGIRYIMRNSYKFFGSGVISYLNQRIVYWFLSINFNKHTIGLYAVAEAVPNMVNNLVSQIGVILYPYVSNDKQNGKKHLIISLSILGIFATLLLIVLLLFGRKLFLFVYGEQYIDSFKPMVILSLAIIFSNFSNLVINYLIGNGKINTLLQYSIISITVISISITILIKYGIIGGALSVLFASATSFIFIMLVFIKFDNIKGGSYN